MHSITIRQRALALLAAGVKRIFTDALDQLGIAWRVMNRKTISVARREAVAALDEFVGPKT